MCSRALIIRQGKLAADTKLEELQSNQRIALQAIGNLKSVTDALQTESWFSAIKPSTVKTVAPSANAFTIETTANCDISEAIAHCAEKLVARSIPIASIHSDKQDLQSLFLDVSTDRSTKDNSSEACHAA